MPNALKQFAAKVTGSRSNQFHLTRLRLTGIYAGLLLAILIISSVITHFLFSTRLEHRFRGRLPFPPPRSEMNNDFRNQVREELVMSLILVNGVLFVSAVGLSYVLAGVTLRPIHQAYNRQRRFLSDASHELRTPLAILQTDLENELVTQKMSGAVKERVQSQLEEVGRMGKIVNDLLLISRLDGNTDHTTPWEAVDLAEVVATTLTRLQGYAAKHAIKLMSSPAGTHQPVTIRANTEHLLQALTNLVKNAIDYNQPGGTVTVNLTHDAKQATLTITDTGIGIPSDQVPKLFDRFYRLDTSRTRSQGGSGLGLSIVQSIVHTYQGSIVVTSKVGEGTVVTLSFPLYHT